MEGIGDVLSWVEAGSSPDSVAEMFPDGEGAVGLHFMLADDKPAAYTPGEKLLSTQGQLHLTRRGVREWKSRKNDNQKEAMPIISGLRLSRQAVFHLQEEENGVWYVWSTWIASEVEIFKVWHYPPPQMKHWGRHAPYL